VLLGEYIGYSHNERDKESHIHKRIRRGVGRRIKRHIQRRELDIGVGRHAHSRHNLNNTRIDAAWDGA